MRPTSVLVPVITLLLLVAVPVGGAPSLQVGSSATYNLSLTVSFAQPYCGTSTTSNTQPGVIYCPLADENIPSFVLNGTIGWTTTGLNRTTALLNVTRDLNAYYANPTAPVFHGDSSLNETINLDNRTLVFRPFFVPEIDQAIQVAETSLSTSLPNFSSTWNSSISPLSLEIWAPRPVYTMWWVNGPLKANTTVPVLVFPTNVTGSTTINIPNIGPRSAWTLNYTEPQLMALDPQSTPVPAIFGPVASFSFNYDQQSDLLLSATANIRLGYPEPLAQSSACTPSANVYCPDTSSNCIVYPYGVDIQATLTLAKTNLDLSQRLGTGSGGSDSGSNSGTNAGSSSGTTTGSNNGAGSSSGPSTGTSGNTGQGGTTTTGSTGSGTTPGNGAAGDSNPGGPQSNSTKFAGASPWLYCILAIIAVAIVVTGIVLARRRSTKTAAPSQTP